MMIKKAFIAMGANLKSDLNIKKFISENVNTNPDKEKNGIFEDFIGMWDNNIDENICKEFIKYYDWTVKHNYHFSPDIGDSAKHNTREDEAIFIGSSSIQYPSSLCDHY